MAASATTKQHTVCVALTACCRAESFVVYASAMVRNLIVLGNMLASAHKFVCTRLYTFLAMWWLTSRLALLCQFASHAAHMEDVP
jgi:hypothetical protein